VYVGYVALSLVTAEQSSRIKGPLSIGAAEMDPIFQTEKRVESENILTRIGATYQINLFSGVGHAFAVRPDISISILQGGNTTKE
jgi:dienelactone hydrolase